MVHGEDHGCCVEEICFCEVTDRIESLSMLLQTLHNCPFDCCVEVAKKVHNLALQHLCSLLEGELEADCCGKDSDCEPC